MLHNPSASTLERPMSVPPPSVEAMVDVAAMRLYERDADLAALPALIHEVLQSLAPSTVTAYGETDFLGCTNRALMSEDLPRIGEMMQNYGRLMQSHPFWMHDPEFFRGRALRETDAFTTEELLKTKLFRACLRQYHMTHIMFACFRNRNASVSLSFYRDNCVPFSDVEKQRVEAILPHVRRARQLAQLKTFNGLDFNERLALLGPSLTPRQIEIASWAIAGKSNSIIAELLGISQNTVKLHLSHTYERLKVDGRANLLRIVHDPLNQFIPSHASGIIETGIGPACLGHIRY